MNSNTLSRLSPNGKLSEQEKDDKQNEMIKMAKNDIENFVELTI